uniref:ORF2 n=1 Tax=Porcine astrovirus 4/BEL/15V010 TaxID=2017722 RepID=A0A221LEA5_9VIRU|nr:ORF2 [Porcine astrovirus 4/BEL/15V010]
MANNQNNVQPKVVTTTTTTTRRRGGRRRRRTPRTSQAGTTTVRKVTINRQSGRPRRRRRNRPGIGGKQAPGGIRQRITATLGTVGSNQGTAIELEMSALLNPALMKETTGSNHYGPLQIYASTYNLWKIESILLKLTPLIGSSAVSGTAVRASLNLSGQPGSPSWSALGARKHKDTNPGRPLYFYLSGSDLKGPKDGWYFCNTKNDPKMCIAGSLEIHTFGQTMSTYKTGQFAGPLFLAEMTCTWSFKDYNPQPGMLNLVKTTLQEQPQQVKILSKPGEPIKISVDEGSLMARTVSGADNLAGATASEIIWQICDSAIEIASGALPAPFTWLFKCGWWFVKRIANKKQNGQGVTGEPDPGEVVFQVYQSISDAQNDVPCIATGNATTTNATINNLEMMQITPGNVGQQQESIAGIRRSVEPTHDPVQVSSRSLTGQKTLFGHIYDGTAPVACVVMQAVGAQQKVYTYCVRELLDPIFVQNGVTIHPDQIDLPSYAIKKKEGETYTPVGEVYLAAYCEIQNSQPIQWTTVCWKATKTDKIKLQRATSNRIDKFIAIRTGQSVAHASLPQTKYYLEVSDAISLGQTFIDIEEGKWYLSTFVAVGAQNPEFANYGVKFYLSRNINVTGGEYQNIADAYNVGAMMNTATPLVLNLNVTRDQSLTTAELAQLRQLLAGTAPPFPLPPPSEYDNLEMPPLEGDEEEEQGATGYTPLEEARQQKVRPPSAVLVFNEEAAPLLDETEDDDDEDYESDLDDDDYADPPSLLKNIFTPEAKSLCDDLKRKGLDHDVAAKAAQVAFPHPALKLWEATYHNALVDGLSPPSARDCAWGAISEYI